MKILVLQLARLGDIYLSWPTIRALRRTQPEAEIHILTRSRFQGAWEGCDAKVKIINFETKSLLAPMISDLPDIQESFHRTSAWLESLEGIQFDRIINLSFSPLSSFITHRLTSAATKEVTGYTRTSDGYLAIPDDMSAYFYAQVGPGRPNRFHLAEIFGTLAGCDLLPEDWSRPTTLTSMPARKGIVVHIGASEEKKSLSASKWSTVCQHLVKTTGNSVTLVGSKEELEKSISIMNSVSSDKVINRVAETQLQDLNRMVNECELLVGCDSAPMHIASLTGTPCVNISFPSVNFWETGPRSAGSRILRVDCEEELASEKIAQVAQQILTGQKSDLSVATVKGSATPSYAALEPRQKEFQWKMLNAIYRGQPFPKSADPQFHNALIKLEEVNVLVMDQLTFVERGGDLKNVAGVLNGAESIIQAIAGLCPDLSTLIRWYQTEKLRISPGADTDILKRTIAIHELLMAAIEVLMESAMAAEIGETP